MSCSLCIKAIANIIFDSENLKKNSFAIFQNNNNNSCVIFKFFIFFFDEQSLSIEFSPDFVDMPMRMPNVHVESTTKFNFWHIITNIRIIIF